MRSGPLWTLQTANIQINTRISRHAWVSWLFIYLAELIFFSAYRLSNLGDLVKASMTPDEDSTATRVYGVLLGIVQDFVVVTFLVSGLCGFDAVINCSAFCNDTAPNGCLDCFTRGIPFRLRAKLVAKRILRATVIYVVCLLSVAVFSIDVVTVRAYHHRYKFDWVYDSEDFAVSKAAKTTIITHTLVVVLVTQGFIAVVTTVWFDVARWTPLRCATRWKGMSCHGLPTVTSRPVANYLVMDSDDFFDSRDNETLSEFFDSNNRPIRGTQPPQPRAILSDDRRDLPTPTWKLAVFGLALAVAIFLIVPLLVLLITSCCSAAVASIALNASLNEPIRGITTLSLIPS
ncbi:hypothetical protein PRIC1_005676 [Phytophthora ramorum]